MDAARAALAYEGLLRVEKAFHGLKNTVDITPRDTPSSTVECGDLLACVRVS